MKYLRASLVILLVIALSVLVLFASMRAAGDEVGYLVGLLGSFGIGWFIGGPLLIWALNE